MLSCINGVLVVHKKKVGVEVAIIGPEFVLIVNLFILLPGSYFTCVCDHCILGIIVLL